MTSPTVLIMKQENSRRTHSTRNLRPCTSGMLFGACHALSAAMGLIVLTSSLTLADSDWAVTTIPPSQDPCAGEDCYGDYEDSLCSVLPELCQPEPTESKRASGFSAWGGKRVPFSTWGGKRTPFSTWGGKRVPFSTWGGKRQGDKKGGNFNAWGGKRVPFSSWGGKRAGAFSSRGGKRADEQVFSAWGGKRDQARDKRASSSGKRSPELSPVLVDEKGLTIRRGSVDFFPWGGKRDQQ
ncbi:uncharacterized protein LOC132195580 [Neocloeon triangulifer]|uniref:uncharacterized protein LOC132195580 n=1 Tax=Neocloeon triangulifer TaxID=2078957 RepID=UPI00286F69D6|nr:uncharacterized protein LOC132195580 [Neocloeon triangulifer]